jgi:predicted esterase
VAIPEAARQELEAGVRKVGERLKALSGRKDVAEFIPDVEIYEKAVRYALHFGEFFKETDADAAKDLLKTANQRLDALEKGEHPWTTEKGLVVRGYRSAIDGSAQPYGLEIPDGLDLSKPVPLYVWLHGRNEKGTDLYFIRERQSRRGQIRPADAIVLHSFGRQCLGYKSAGEIDVLEAIDSAEHRYPIDPDRVALMGFSMGGAGAWHVGAHYTDRFAVVHAGAGFVDVARFQRVPKDRYPAWYEQTLWGVYDVPDYVRNLFNVPVVAYSGEIDRQRQAAEIMAEAFKAEGRELTHLIGPGKAHEYHPDTLAEVMRRVHDAIERGRDRFPTTVSLQTRTLRYNHMKWVALTALEEHWKDTRLDAQVKGNDGIEVKTKNVAGFTLSPPWREAGDGARKVEVVIDGQILSVPAGDFAGGHAQFAKKGDTWVRGDAAVSSGGLHKVPGLQGPIDDAFLEPFLVVLPSGKCEAEAVQKWVNAESAHMQERWQAALRGDVRVKKDTEVTDDDIARYHLVLWGDPSGNRVIRRIADKLPPTAKWDATHVPVLIYPNPLNAKRYVVLNSGPTFREEDDRSNALQNPRLPDWAVVDVTTPPSGTAPGKVESAGFFDERWQLKPSR